FRRNSVGTWEEKQKIYAPDHNKNDFFGRSIDIDGAYAIVGADLEDEDANQSQTVPGAGSAYLFKLEDSGWNFAAKLIGTEREVDDYFGQAVAISLPHVAVGAWNADPRIMGNTILNGGSGYIFEQEEMTTSSPLVGAYPPLQIFPNPSENLLEIKDHDFDLLELHLTDIHGNLLRQLDPRARTFECPGLPSGIYTLIARDETQKTMYARWIKS
ncbi:MAG: FG-GAP repeat protein, partial [Saprospiraceae bacterium]|nr:FG-GAP repeat protein [Saprospiraceae bacterium]